MAHFFLPKTHPFWVPFLLTIKSSPQPRIPTNQSCTLPFPALPAISFWRFPLPVRQSPNRPPSFFPFLFFTFSVAHDALVLNAKSHVVFSSSGDSHSGATYPFGPPIAMNLR
jgi:hypothetical protein